MMNWKSMENLKVLAQMQYKSKEKMMKKIFTIMLCAVISMAVITGCGSDKKADTDTKNDGTSETSVYTYEINGVSVAMNENMEPLVEKLGEADNYFESESCAFQGMDKVYTYGSVKITTYPKDDKDYVYTIELLDDTVSTPEGISIGSSKSDVEEKYGKASDETDTSYIYKKGDSQLSFIFDGDDVSSIVYNAITD